MAKQTFTTGQVLTAAQMTSLQQTAMGGGSATAKTASYVLVAADAGGTVAMNAAGATTITVNTALFAAGDTVFIQNLGAGACTVTAGTATVATAGSLILPQNDAGILYFTATGASIFYDYIQAGAVSPLTTKGDLYTFSTSDARLAVGTNGTTLVADSSESVGMKWQAASSGGMTLLSTTTLSGATTTISSIDGSYNNLQILIQGITINTASATVEMRPNAGNSSSAFQTNATNSSELVGPIKLSGNNAVDNTGGVNVFCVNIFNYASSTYEKTFSYFSKFTESAATKAIYGGGGIDTASAITSIAIACGGGRTFSGGQVLIYGVK